MTRRAGRRAAQSREASREGWEGWDDYAPFYDWENLRTQGRRDVPFWERLAVRTGGPVLELGCGTGRLLLPVARTGVRIVGVDRSGPMLARARQRVRRARLQRRAALVRADIRRLPFGGSTGFALVMAPYGMLQSLIRDADLSAALAEVRRVLRPGGVLGIDLVADLPAWQEYQRHQSLSGWRPGRRVHVSLVESVRQDRARGVTIFEQEYTERRGREQTVRRFDLSFRTVTVPQMTRRLERAGFEVTAVLGDYEGRPWDTRAETWVILARSAP